MKEGKMELTKIAMLLSAALQARDTTIEAGIELLANLISCATSKVMILDGKKFRLVTGFDNTGYSSPKDCNQKLKKLSLRPATVEEMEMFGRHYPIFFRPPQRITTTDKMEISCNRRDCCYQYFLTQNGVESLRSFDEFEFASEDHFLGVEEK